MTVTFSAVFANEQGVCEKAADDNLSHIHTQITGPGWRASSVSDGLRLSSNWEKLLNLVTKLILAQNRYFLTTLMRQGAKTALLSR